ncbi:hypothetical protein O181_030360 [Austropuccinia psidii MF-1]|uniref:Uncharacterized protein n=1 Tax=Austropuccinia psidii MF-1 TaxID=1389203 RepID=A0A9Q3H658_9BASI|nr:hypothetical protein [Austropuccinia psidii MF-1]
MEITKGWNPNKKLKLLQDRASKIRENQATIKAIDEKWNQKEHIITLSGSQLVVNQLNSPVASHHSESSRSVTKSDHYLQFEVVFRRRQGTIKKNKTSFNQRQKESYPIS